MARPRVHHVVNVPAPSRPRPAAIDPEGADLARRAEQDPQYLAALHRKARRNALSPSESAALSWATRNEEHQ